MAERREGEEQADRRESYAELRCEVRWAKTGLEEEADCYQKDIYRMKIISDISM